MAKPKGWRPLTDDEKQEIIRRYAAGELLTALAAEYHRDKRKLKEILRGAGLTIRGVGYPKGTPWTPEHREAHRKATSTPEFAEKSRQELLKRLPRMRGPAVNTPIERRMHDALRKAGIGFTTQSLLLERYLVDIELQQAPVIIEADGAHHALTGQRVKDAERDAELNAAGYRVFRFTGSEINTDAGECLQRVIDACGLTPDEDPVYEIRTAFSGAAHPRWKGGKREFTCEACGTVFLSQPANRRGPHVYCGIKCANGARRGQPMSAEQKAKISAGLMGIKRPRTPEHSAKIGAAVSRALKGKPKSPEHVAKVAAANRGRTVSAETRAKISASLKRYNSQIKIESEPARERRRPAETTGPATRF